MLTNKGKTKKVTSKKMRRKKAIIAGLYSLAMLSFASSILGTYAWYFYASKTGFNFKARTVGNFDNLQIGIASAKRLPKFRSYGLLEEDTSILNKGYYIYWARGGLTSHPINYVSSSNGYATEKLGPVTTGRYYHSEDNGTLQLHNGPSNGFNYIPGEENFNSTQFEVNKIRYTKLMFVFRIGDYTQGAIGKPDVPIYLTVDNVDTNHVDARMALRFYVRNALEGGDTFLVAPMYEHDGYVNVGGPLDLSSDGLYDVYEKDGVNKELPYGEFKEDKLVYKAVSDEETNLVDKKDITTFNANHHANSYAIDMENSEPEVAEFYGGNKLLQPDFYVGKTNPQLRNYAIFEMTIFIEGWDPSVVDSADLSQFDLGMTFYAK